jgi:hypothetical protein
MREEERVRGLDSLQDSLCVVSGPVVQVMHVTALLDEVHDRGVEDISLIEPSHDGENTEGGGREEEIGECFHVSFGLSDKSSRESEGQRWVLCMGIHIRSESVIGCKEFAAQERCEETQRIERGGGAMRLKQGQERGRRECHEIRREENILAIEEEIELIFQGGVADHCAAMEEEVLNPKEIIAGKGLVIISFSGRGKRRGREVVTEKDRRREIESFGQRMKSHRRNVCRAMTAEPQSGIRSQQEDGVDLITSQLMDLRTNPWITFP